jgi:Cellulase (glycosyl hydrolase family 5)
VHNYFDSDQSGTHATVTSATVGAQYFAGIICWARLNSVKLWIGEYGAGNNDLAVQCLNNLAASFAVNSDVIEGVTIWGGGDFESSLQPGGYALGVEPFNGADTPQLLSLLNLAPGGAFYGQKPTVNAFPLNLTSASFGSATWGGQALTGGWGTPTNTPNKGLTACTLASISRARPSARMRRM